MIQATTDRGGEEVDTTTVFPVVGIGASAGGLDPLRKLFSHLPRDTGMAFVVIQHLHPMHASMLAALLTADVQMQVVEVHEATRVEPNRVYVIPPGADLTMREGVLALLPRTQARSLHLPIDLFFRALAADVSRRAIGIVLSGSASDGTDGLRAIRAAGGFALVQAPTSAQFRSMPESVIAANVFDFQGTPEEIAAEIVRLGREPYLSTNERLDAGSLESGVADPLALQRILKEISRNAHFDFAGYKRPTILRRILRRMVLGRMTSLEEYAAALQDNPTESIALARDVLIHVTWFFRDPASFEALKQKVFPVLLAAKAENASFRIWVPGCSTGQEAYSLAICLTEFLDEHHRQASVKIFGTDLGDSAIEVARSGLYAEAELVGLNERRIRDYFERVEGRYRILRRIRELCVFVRHDLTRDPPFAKLDLVSCRNVLIYFDFELQRRVVPLLHHCLNRPGFLLLGSSEGIREFQSNFQPIDKPLRIYAKSGESPRLEYPMALGKEAESRLPISQTTQRTRPAQDARRQADHLLLARYAPAGVVVNEQFEVIEFRGRIGAFLEPPPGKPQINVLRLAREGLVEPLRESLETAKAQTISVRREGVMLAEGTQNGPVALEVSPLNGVNVATERFFLVVFESQARPSRVDEAPARERDPPERHAYDDAVARLRTELLASREYLHTIAGEHQDTVEELEAANEELLAANEELQSTNEELQSAKEELQSANEELITLNEELSQRNHE